MQGLLLGLANGTACLATCAPVLLPFLLGEGKRPHQNGILLLQFLGGRLIGYLIFGLLAWWAFQSLFQESFYRTVLSSLTYIGLSLILVIYALGKKGQTCAVSYKDIRAWLRRYPALLPAGMGLLTGLNICPPFLLAATASSQTGSLLNSLIFFALFFAGTSVYFIPVPFIGLLRRHQALQTIGKLSALVSAAYYIYTGLIQLIGVFA